MNEYSLDLTALGVFSGYYETFWDDRYTGTIEQLGMDLMDQFGEKIDFDYKLDYDQVDYEVGTAFAGWFENEFDKLVSEAVDSFNEEFDDAGDGSGVWFTDSWYCNYEEIIYNNITEVTVNGEAVELIEDRWEFVSKEKESKQLALI